MNSIIRCKAAIDFFADVKNNKPCQLLRTKWSSLIEMAEVLDIPLRATIEFQRRDLNLSDVYLCWLKMELSLKKIKKPTYCTGLSDHLYQCLNKRKNVVFDNPFMNAAIFLDPRLHRSISTDEEKMDQAKITLKNIWQRMERLKNAPKANDESVENTSNNATLEMQIDDELFQILHGAQRASDAPPNSSTSAFDIAIEDILDSFQPEYLDHKADVLEFWEKIKEDNEVLYQLSTFIFSVPPTEVTIERNFSSLNFVFSDRRCKIQSERLEDIMLINLNKDMFDEFTKNELKSLNPAKKKLDF